MKVSIAQARRDLSQILKQARQAPVIVTRRGEPDAVILLFQEYQFLRHLGAYLRMIRFSEQLKGCGVTATELALYKAGGRELLENL